MLAHRLKLDLHLVGRYGQLLAGALLLISTISTAQELTAAEITAARTPQVISVSFYNVAATGESSLGG